MLSPKKKQLITATPRTEITFQESLRFCDEEALSQVSPSALLTSPASQSLQVVDPMDAAYFPAAQSEQLEAPDAENLPAEHESVHAVARPVELENLPAVQSEQLEAPVDTS